VFTKGSRYAKVPRLTYVDESGRVVTYTAIRLIPETPAVAGHRVVEGDRLDGIAWDQFRDPERYWRVCDANDVLWPDDLLEEGLIIDIPTAEG
jgi:hypothetical protein